MGKRSSAFPLIGAKLPQYCLQLSKLPPSEFWIHESKLAEYLKLPRGAEHGPSEVLTAILAALKNGHGGSTRAGTKVMTGFNQVDLSNAKNSMGIHYQQFGANEVFETGHLKPHDDKIIRKPRWFKFGDICAIEVSEQLEIAKELIGDMPVGWSTDDPAVLPQHIIKRRKDNYQRFYKGENGAAVYRSWDVPLIASRFLDFWDGVELNDFRQGEAVQKRSFDPEDLEQIENDFRSILCFSNIVGRLDIDSAGAWVAKQTTQPCRPPRVDGPGPRDGAPANEESASGQDSPAKASSDAAETLAAVTPSPSGSRATSSSSSSGLPDSLRKKSLLCTEQGVINWSKVNELAALELMIHLAKDCDIAWDHIELEIPSALKEGEDTFDKIMAECRKSDDESIRKLTMINGVPRRGIFFGDPFHWGNLAVMHASKGMAGDTENGEHEQVHHQQCLMSMHSLHSDDAAYSQSIMDQLMTGQERVKIRTWKERQQRWLVNQRYANKVMAMLACSTGLGVVCLVAWALYFANTSRSAWKARVGKEIATWLSKPEIVLGIQYEAELGAYFEEVCAWHNRTGPHNPRSGFRMMEIFDLYFKYEVSWWNTVNKNPRLQMPRTMEYLETNFSGDDFEMRLHLIKRGLEAGRAELIKITRKYLFQVPILLLVLCNDEHGPAFLRACLSALYENKEKVSTCVLIHDPDSDEWGRFKYDNTEDRPEEERAWYNLLTKSEESINDLIHWWRQMCLNYPVLIKDLQKLSRVDTVEETNAGEGAPLNRFKTEFPVLFDCLYSVFGTMLSNSRLCEQVHGMSRLALRIQIGLDQADHQRIYSFRTDHEMKEERRNMSTDADEYRGKHKKAATHSRSKQQLVRLSEQCCERSSKLAKSVSLMDKDKIPSIQEINEKGRRVQDKENLLNQLMVEEERAGSLRRKHLMPEDLTDLANATKLTNDITYVADPKVILWRERMKELLKIKFWNAPADEMLDKLSVASETFVDWHHSQSSIDALTRKDARLGLIRKHLQAAKDCSAHIHGYVGKFDHKGVNTDDIFSAFMRVSPNAFGD